LHEPAAEKIRRQGDNAFCFREKNVLTGTTDALTALGLAYMRPTPEERNEMNRIIMDELVCSVFKAEAVAYFQRVYARMKDAGCDAVVLGCTEIPLIVNDANSPLQTLDSTRLLARAALRRAVAA
jgi:aspartate racemase